MANFILVMGAPSTGKSTFLEVVRNDIGLEVPIYSKDELKIIMYETIGVKDLELSQKQGAAAWDTLFYIMRQLAQTQGQYIFEANFKPHHRDAFAELEQANSGYYFDQILFTADAEVLVERFTNRAQTDRHPGHQDSNRDASIDAIRATSANEGVFAELGGSRVTVDTTVLESVDYSKAIALIRQRFAKQA